MVVPAAIRVVGQHVEGGGFEGLPARLAHEALSVVPSRQPPVRGRDGFSEDRGVAAAAEAFGGRGGKVGGEGWGGEGRRGGCGCGWLRWWWGFGGAGIAGDTGDGEVLL